MQIGQGSWARLFLIVALLAVYSAWMFALDPNYRLALAAAKGVFPEMKAGVHPGLAHEIFSPLSAEARAAYRQFEWRDLGYSTLMALTFYAAIGIGLRKPGAAGLLRAAAAAPFIYLFAEFAEDLSLIELSRQAADAPAFLEPFQQAMTTLKYVALAFSALAALGGLARAFTARSTAT